MPIKVRISSVDLVQKQMFLDFGDSGNSAQTPSLSHNGKIKELAVKRPAKPFRLYTAKVMGTWPYGGSSPDTTAELVLNGGSIGRLHASEINIEKYAAGSFPMKEFLRNNLGKTVTIKVICVGKPKNLSEKGKELLMDKYQTSRIVECTLDEAKITEPRKKLKLIHYANNFEYGCQIAAFVVSPEHGLLNASTLLAKTIFGEANPAFKVIIGHQRVNKVLMPPTKESGDLKEVHAEQFSSGELIFGKIVGVNKTRRGKYIELSLIDEEKKPKKKKRKLSKSAEGIADEEVIRSESTGSIEEAKPDTKELDMPTAEKSQKSKLSKPSERKRKFVKVHEPSFEWSLAGFTPQDMADVGKKSSNEELIDDGVRKLTAEEQRLLGAGTDTEIDFDRLVTGNPNASELWIRYVAFFISRKDYDQAKGIAERALTVINFQENEELFNIWKVYVNLEVMFGTEESLKEVFSRSCASTNSLKMHKHLANTLKSFGKNEEAGDVFELMLKKFRHDDLDVWYLYAEHLLEIGEVAKNRELLQRAVQSLEKKHHIAVLCRFATLEYKHGDLERGKTMFEKILHTYGKKTIVWTLFLDMVLKYESIIEARKVFERAITANPMSEKLKIFLKKWMEAEEKHGDEESQNLVRERAAKLVVELKEDNELD